VADNAVSDIDDREVVSDIDCREAVSDIDDREAVDAVAIETSKPFACSGGRSPWRTGAIE
jgi:hypothetical protein